MQAIQSLIFLALLIGIFYFMLIRPQKRRVEAHRSLIESLRIGDEIVTIGGMYGTIASLGDDEVEIEAGTGVRLRFVKSAIARKVEEEYEEAEAEEYGSTGEADEA